MNVQLEKETADGISVVLVATMLGDDVNVSISGGDRPHIGAVALAQARPSLADDSKVSASISVLTVLGHKEDMLAREVAARIAVAVNGIASVSCGIHVDEADGDQIASILVCVKELVEELLQHLRSSEGKR